MNYLYIVLTYRIYLLIFKICLVGDEVWVEAEQEGGRGEQEEKGWTGLDWTEEGLSPEAGWNCSEWSEYTPRRDIMVRFLVPPGTTAQDLSTYMDHEGQLCIAIQRPREVDIPVGREEEEGRRVAEIEGRRLQEERSGGEGKEDLLKSIHFQI